MPPAILLLSSVIPLAHQLLSPLLSRWSPLLFPLLFRKNRAATVTWQIHPDNSRPHGPVGRCLRKPLAFCYRGRLEFPMARKARVSAAMVALMGDGEHH